MQSRLIEVADDLLPLEEAWNDLCLRQDRPNPMLSWDWVTAWWNVYGKADPKLRLAVLVWENTDRLVMALPLYTEPTASGKVFRFLGSGEAEADAVCADYLGPLVEPTASPDLWGKLVLDVAKLLRKGDLLALHDLDTSIEAVDRLHDGFRTYGLACRKKPGSICPFVTLPPQADEWLRALSSNFRSQLRQSRRFWQAQTSPKVDWVHETGDLKGFFQELTRLHQLRWARMGKPGVFSSKLFSTFHREILTRFHRRGWLLGGVLRSEGKVCAANHAFFMSGNVFFYQSGVDPEAPSKLRPGLLLHHEMINEAIRKGAREYDFLRGDDPYKQRFTKEARTMVHLEVAWPSWTQKAKWCRDAVKDRLRPLRDRFLSR